MKLLSNPYACFFPTKTIFIDDSKEFLDSVALNLSYNSQSYKFFSNIYEALEYINQNKANAEWFKSYIKLLEEEEDERKIIEINIGGLYNQLYNSNKFNVITNLVIDYDMPEMNGLDICNKLANLNINKILLTGAADEKLAVNAFNNDLIDNFIPKHTPNIYAELKEAIDKGANSYFNILSKIIFSSIQTENECFFIKEQPFKELFNSFLEKNQIIEYYLIDSSGSFLLINAKGMLDILHFANEKQLDSFYQLILEEGLALNLLNELKQRDKMLCYNNFDNKTLPIQEWHKYFKTTKKIIIKDKPYYYHYMKNFQLNKNFPIFSRYIS